MALNIPMPRQGYEEFGGGLEEGENLAMSPYKRQLVQAQAERAKKMAQLPFGGANVPGVAGHVMGLQMMKMMYGEDSPQYKQALDAFNMQQKAVQSRTNYQDVLSGSVPMRYATQQGKSLMEQSNVNQGASPIGTPAGQPTIPGMPPYKSPMSPQDAAEQYNLKRMKENVPSDVLKRNLFATNIDKTLDNLNVDDLTAYSGIKGTGQLLKDASASASGQNVEKYKKYKDAVTASKTLAKQVRQFYGDSITPSVQEGLASLTDPTTWLKNPEVAKSSFNKFKSILQQETQTYRDASKGTAVYGGAQQPVASAEAGAQPAESSPVNANIQAQAAEAKSALISNGFSPEEADQMIKERMAKLQGGG